MKPILAATILLLLAVTFAAGFPVLAVAQAGPSLLTDQSFYTLRDKQVVLQGVGFKAKGSYVIWIQAPLDNSTRNSGQTFTATDKGEIPPGVSLPIEPTSPLGTYLVSISDQPASDTGIARAHYGTWSTDKYVYQRTEVVQVKGGGILPKGSLKATIRNPAAAFVYDATIAANETGTFVTTWKIPPDAITESYTVFIDGVGTYDHPDKEFVSISKFSVTPAVLNVTVLAQPAVLYERMQIASAEFLVQYRDSTPVTSVKEGLKPAVFYAGQFKVADLGLSPSGATSGIWVGQVKIPRNATLGVKYKFMLPASSFDDGYGNTGPENDIETDSFGVNPAMLKISTSFNSTHYQVPFDTMTAYAQVTYPDGEATTNATVRGWLTYGNSKVNATVSYDEAAAVWVVKHAFLWNDLLRPGAWNLTLEAKDSYGNVGSASAEVTVEPYTVLEMILAVIVALVVARWLLSKYWRRLYLGAKRVLSAFRGRLTPPSLGRYFSDSPVTP